MSFLIDFFLFVIFIIFLYPWIDKLDGGAELDENTELGNHIIQRFPLHMYARLIDIRHSWVTFWKREKVKKFQSIS